MDDLIYYSILGAIYLIGYFGSLFLMAYRRKHELNK